MPTYEYECRGCGHQFERFQTITARRVRKCPECGALKVRRLMGTGATLIFKGSGFYTTDYRSEDYKKKASADKPPASPTAASDAKASDGKKDGKAAR